MDPNQQPYGQQPNAHQNPQPATNPYSFITDMDHRPQKKRLAPSGSFRSRLLFVVGGGLVIIILVIVISQLAFGGKASNTKLLTDIVAEQTEIVRISDMGTNSGRSTETLAFAATTKATVSSQKAALAGYLKSKNVKLTTATANAKKNAQTDAALNDAITKNDFDNLFNSTIRGLLNNYASDLKTAYDQASNKTSKALLADSYNSTKTLLKN